MALSRCPICERGLTRREYYAAARLQAIKCVGCGSIIRLAGGYPWIVSGIASVIVAVPIFIALGLQGHSFTAFIAAVVIGVAVDRLFRFIPIGRMVTVVMGDGRCKNCGYELTGLTSERCPECGVPHGRRGASGQTRAEVS